MSRGTGWGTDWGAVGASGGVVGLHGPLHFKSLMLSDKLEMEVLYFILLFTFIYFRTSLLVQFRNILLRQEMLHQVQVS